MRQYEPFKRLFRIGSAAILMGVITGIYGCVWNGYFNKLIEFPFWRRGNWLMIALYAGLLFFFLMTYGGISNRVSEKRKPALFPDLVNRSFERNYLHTNIAVG